MSLQDFTAHAKYGSDITRMRHLIGQYLIRRAVIGQDSGHVIWKERGTTVKSFSFETGRFCSSLLNSK